MGRCPPEFCYRSDSPIMLLPRDVVDQQSLDRFVCHPSHRTGRLCSQCIDGYSVAINSPTFACKECEDSELGILHFFFIHNSS